MEGKYLLQLGGNDPDIAEPGMWFLFGESIEENEMIVLE
jgi:hypothetical protein